jgi:hypothetical protein
MSGIPFDNLTAQQRQGMTAAYWNELSPAQQGAFVDRRCIKGDGRPRVPGGIYCDHHTALLQSGYRSGED